MEGRRRQKRHELCGFGSVRRSGAGAIIPGLTLGRAQAVSFLKNSFMDHVLIISRSW